MYANVIVVVVVDDFDCVVVCVVVLVDDGVVVASDVVVVLFILYVTCVRFVLRAVVRSLPVVNLEYDSRPSVLIAKPQSRYINASIPTDKRCGTAVIRL